MTNWTLLRPASRAAGCSRQPVGDAQMPPPPLRAAASCSTARPRAQPAMHLCLGQLRCGTQQTRATRRRGFSVVAQGARSPFPNHQTWLARGDCDGPESPFHALQLTDAERNAGGQVRSRNYSFLSSDAGQQATQVDWAATFNDTSLPLVADLGCGAGRYVLLMGRNDAARSSNYLGLDVHKALLDRANGWAAARGLSGHVAYVQANVVVSAAAILGSYPGRRVRLVSIQYPDPQQRRRRHVVGRQLVAALAEVLPSGAQVYLNSDFEDTATYMRNCFERFGAQHFDIDTTVHVPGSTFPCSEVLQPVRPDVVTPQAGRRPRASGAGDAAPGTAAGRSASGDDAPSGPGSGSESGGEGGGGGGSGGEAVDEEEVDLLFWRQGRWREAGWLLRNPVGAPTEREVYVELATRQQVYRVMLVRR